MNGRDRLQSVPLSLLLGEPGGWHSALWARQVLDAGGRPMRLPGSDVLALALDTLRESPVRAWARITDSQGGFAVWIDRPAWLAQDLEPEIDPTFLSTVLLERLAPLFEALDQWLGVRWGVPRVEFGAAGERGPAEQIPVRLLSQRESSPNAAWLDLRLGDASLRHRLLSVWSSPEAGATAAEFRWPEPSADVGLRGWVVEAHARITRPTLQRTVAGDGLVLDPFGPRGRCGLWVAHADRWLEIGTLAPAGNGQFELQALTFAPDDLDAALPVAPAQESSGGSGEPVAAMLGSIRLGADSLVALSPGLKLQIALLAGRRRALRTPNRRIGVAEMLHSGAQRIARLIERAG